MVGMSGDWKNSLSGSLFRLGVSLIVVAIGLRWIVCVLQSTWMWLAGGLVVIGGLAALATWWRNRHPW